MPDREDITDPLMKVPVSEYMCQKRTDKIMRKLDVIYNAQTKQTAKLDKHLVRHEVSNSVKKEGRDKLVSIFKIIGVIFSILVALGALVWSAAQFMRPDVKQLAAEIANHNNNPVVEYSADEEDP